MNKCSTLAGILLLHVLNCLATPKTAVPPHPVREGRHQALYSPLASAPPRPGPELGVLTQHHYTHHPAHTTNTTITIHTSVSSR